MTTLAAPTTTQPDYRAGRYRARHFLWDNSGLRRVRACGRVHQANDALVTVKVSTSADGVRSAGYGNLQTCGSVWACPCCSAKIAAERQREIAAALAAWHARGGRVALLTLTMRHRKGQRLATLWDALSGAWNASASGAQWKADQKVYGTLMPRTIRTGKRAGEVVESFRVPVIRAVEVTHGAAGWHAHIHALLLLDGSATSGAANAVGWSMFTRWRDHLVGRGLEAPTRAHGYDVRLLDGDPSDGLADYFTKAVYSASHEVARSDLKGARGRNRTPFHILRDLVETNTSGDLGDLGQPEDEDVWAEWERTSRGRRQITWTQGLRDFLGLTDELTDEEIAAEDHGGEVEHDIEPPVFRLIVRDRADLEVLRAFERDPLEGAHLVMGYRARVTEDQEHRARGRARWRRRE